MSRWASRRWDRLGYAAATGAGLGSILFWVGYWFTFVRGDLQGPDFFSFYSGAKLFVLKGGSAVYDLALQKQYELQVIPHAPDQFVVLPYFHPPYYTLLIAPLAFLDYRGAYYAMAAFNVALAVVLIAILIRGSERIHGRAAIVSAALIGGFFPLFVTVLQGQSDLVVLVPLASAYLAWALGGSLPTNGQIVYTDTAVYSLRNILEAVPGGGKAVALVVLILLLALVALSLSWRPDKPRLDFA